MSDNSIENLLTRWTRIGILVPLTCFVDGNPFFPFDWKRICEPVAMRCA